MHLDRPDFTWLGKLLGWKGGRFEEEGKFKHSATGNEIQSFRALSYEPSTRTIICHARWEEIDANGQVANSWQTAPARLHCVNSDLKWSISWQGWDSQWMRCMAISLGAH